MFEAHFQSFDDRGERGASAARVAALRAELARARARRLHRAARRPLSERICAALRRAARLAYRLHRLGGPRDRARRPRRAVRRRPLSGAGARGSRRRGLLRRASGRAAAAGLDRSQCAGRHETRLFALAAHRRRRRTARQSLRRGARASLVPVDDNPIDAIWTDRPAPPLGAVVLHDLRYAGEDAASQARARARRNAEVLPPTRWWSPTRTRSRGCSTSAAATFRTRRWCSPSPPCPRRARPTLFVDLRKLGNEVRSRLEEIRRGARPNAAFERDLAALGGEHRAVRLDPAACPEAIARLVAENGGKVAARRPTRSRR